jgi:hypothetical protein
MEKSDKQEILEAIAMLASQVGGIDDHMTGLEGRMTGLENRMGGMEDRLDEFMKETRTRFDGVDRRLDSLEETVGAMSTSLDTLLEGDVLGKDHITLTRPEYNSLMHVANLPNRFEESAH